jgi:acetyl-CoA carboxylase biotin carboxyl carrier protein
MAKFEIDTQFVRKLAELLKETGLSEIEYAEGDKRIRCVGAVSQQTFIPMAAPVAAPAAVAVAPSAAKEAVASGTPVTSPMVGTVYLAPEPGAAPYVKVGDKVKAGDTLLIIEAMKVMNPIKATASGTVSEITVKDASPVEFGETLLLLA